MSAEDKTEQVQLPFGRAFVDSLSRAAGKSAMVLPTLPNQGSGEFQLAPGESTYVPVSRRDLNSVLSGAKAMGTTLGPRNTQVSQVQEPSPEKVAQQPQTASNQAPYGRVHTMQDLAQILGRHPQGMDVLERITQVCGTQQGNIAILQELGYYVSKSRQVPIPSSMLGGGVIGSGNVTGPGSSTDNAAARYDGTTGELIQNSDLIIEDPAPQGTEIHTAESGGGSPNPLIVRPGNTALVGETGKSLALKGGANVDAGFPGGDVEVLAGQNLGGGSDGQVKIGTSQTNGVTVGAATKTNTLRGTTTVPATDLVTPSLAIEGDANTGVAGTGGDALSLVANGNYGLVIDGTAPGTPSVDIPGFVKNPTGMGFSPQPSRPGGAVSSLASLWAKSFIATNTAQHQFAFDGANDLTAVGPVGQVQASAKTGAYTVTAQDHGSFIKLDGSGSSFNVTLPSCASVPNGFTVLLQRVDQTSANTLQVLRAGSDTINGAAGAIRLQAGATSEMLVTYAFTSDGVSNWRAWACPLFQAGGIPTAWGGTNITSYATGDLLYAASAVNLAKLAIGSADNVLRVSGGLPSWGPLNLSSANARTGTLPEGNGGTNQTTYATGDILYASVANTLAKRAIGSTGQVLTVSGGVPTWAGAAIDNGIMDFRLCGASGTPVPTSDTTTISTLYLTPYKGNRIALYYSSAWQLFTTAEVSKALSSLTSGKPYDVFARWDGSAVQLEFEPWTNDTTRGTALAYLDGVLVKSGGGVNSERRYVGTFYTTAANATTWVTVADVASATVKAYIWNYYNRVRVALRLYDSTNSFTYSSTIQAWNGSANAKLNVICGLAESAIDVSAMAVCSMNNTGGSMFTCIGYDSTAAAATGGLSQMINSSATNRTLPVSAHLNHVPAVGLHYYSWLHGTNTGATWTWYGDGGATGQQSGMNAIWEA